MGACNYCREKITKSYLYFEILAGIIAVLCAIRYGSNIENYMIMFSFYIIAALSCFIYNEHKIIFKNITAILLIQGALYRTLSDNAITPWLCALSIAAIISLYLIKDELYNIKRQELVHIILLASVWLTSFALVFFIFSTIILFFVNKNFYNRSIILLMLLLF